MEFDMRILGIAGIVWVGIAIAMWQPRFREAFGFGFTIISIIIMAPIDIILNMQHLLKKLSNWAESLLCNVTWKDFIIRFQKNLGQKLIFQKSNFEESVGVFVFKQ